MLNKQKVVVDSDDAGLTVLKSVLPAPYIPGPYLSPHPPPGVPSLVWLCICKLYQQPEQLHVLNVRLNFRNELNDIDLYNTDPRLWATLVQIYDDLPHKFSTYTIPLEDVHLPLLQQIPCTPHFSLVTVLELPSCKSLDDTNITRLKMLHSLTAFDASDTPLTPYAFKCLAGTLLLNEGDDEDAQRQHRGPWPLRILSLRSCKSINDHVLPHLAKFILLAVVDLRGTKCTYKASTLSEFASGGDPLLFHPNPLHDSLTYLDEISPSLYSSPNPYTLHIKELVHRPTQARPRATITPENVLVTMPSTSSGVIVGNADHLAKIAEVREDAARHRRNKEAWYDRQDRMLLNNNLESGRRMNRSTPVPSSSTGISLAEGSRLDKRMSQSSWIGKNIRKKRSSPHASDHTANPSTRRHSDVGPNTRSKPTSVNAFCETKSNLQAVRPNPHTPANQSGLNLYSQDQFSETYPSRQYGHVSESERAVVGSTVAIRETRVSEILVDSFYRNEQRVNKVRPLTTQRSQFEIGTTRVDQADAYLMLYREPPPWSALEDAISSLKIREMKRKEDVRIATTIRKTQLANVDHIGMQAARQQLEGLVMKRRRLHEHHQPPPIPMPQAMSKNPFRKRQSCHDNTMANNTLKPISNVKVPLFTQDVLDAQAKENMKVTLSIQTTLRRSASMDPMTTAKRRGMRVSDVNKPVGSVGFDWKKWGQSK